LSEFILTYKAFGFNAVLIEWQPQQISVDILKDIQQFQKVIEREFSECVIECIAAYASLTVVYAHISFEHFVEQLKASYQKQKKQTESTTNTVWQLPACYHTTVGFDLLTYAKKVELTIDEIIHLHTATIYTIYFLGFLPGYLSASQPGRLAYYW